MIGGRIGPRCANDSCPCRRGPGLDRRRQRRRGRVRLARPRHGGYDVVSYRRILGAANPYKEGDCAQGIGAANEASRENSRRLLSNTTIGALLAHPVYDDEVVAFADAEVDPAVRRRIEPWTLGELARFLLDQPEEAIKGIMPGLSSDVIACVVKLMSNDELIAVGRKVFNPLPGSNVGARGYLGARIQPNSPTDDPEDIVWQVLDGWSYAVGDVVLGTNPVSSDVASVAAIELALRELLTTFQTRRRAAALRPRARRRAGRGRAPVSRESTALWFQSLAGVTEANATFDISVGKMRAYAARADRALRACISRPARGPTSPTARARASTW